MAAEVIVTLTLTPTSDRPQELVLTEATAIVNQVCWTWKLWSSRGYVGRSSRQSESSQDLNFEAV
jgi:hypothetical protein